MIEHGAYRLLLDRYYATEKGIPADQAHRLARARTREEREAVDTVLAEFFVLEDGIWRNGRADEEVAKAQVKITAAQENGKKGGRPKKNPEETQKKPTGLSVGSENETQTKAHQTPDTKHQYPEATNAGLSDSTSVAPAADDFAPTLAGQVGKVMRAAGVDATTINLADPRLAELLRQGATPDEFEGLAREAVSKGVDSPWPWVLKVLPERRKQAKSIALSPKTGPVESDYERRMREQAVEACGIFAGSIAKRPPTQPRQPIKAEEVIDAEPATPRLTSS